MANVPAGAEITSRIGRQPSLQGCDTAAGPDGPVEDQGLGPNGMALVISWRS